MSRSYSYETILLEDLKKPREAVAYLNDRLVDDGEGDYEALLLMGLRNVALAHGISDIAERSFLSRESLYKTLSPTGNPRLTTLIALLDAVGLQLRVAIKPKPKPKKKRATKRKKKTAPKPRKKAAKKSTPKVGRKKAKKAVFKGRKKASR